VKLYHAGGHAVEDTTNYDSDTEPNNCDGWSSQLFGSVSES